MGPPRVRRQPRVLPRHRLREDRRLAHRDARRLGPVGGGRLLPGHPRQARDRGPVRGRRQVQERAEPVHREGLHRAPPGADGGARRSRCSTSTSRAWRERRGLEEDEVRALIDRGPFRRGRGAGPAGSWTSCSTATRSRSAFPARAARRRRATSRPRAGSGSTGGRRSRSSTRWATSCPGESQSSPFGGGLAGADTIVRGLRQAREDDDGAGHRAARGQPGGLGHGLGRDLARGELARRTKPVVASMGDYAASGGYYVAMGADEIVAQPGTITGSIGVFSGKFSLRGLYEKLGRLAGDGAPRATTPTLFSSLGAVDARRSGRRSASLNEAFYETFVGQGGRGPEEDRRARSTRWPRAASGPGREALGRGPRGPARGPRRRGRGPPGSAPASRRARRCSSWCCRERKGLLETLLERQEEDVLARALGPAAPPPSCAGPLTLGGPGPDRPRCPSSSRFAERARSAAVAAGAGPASHSRRRPSRLLAVDRLGRRSSGCPSRPWPRGGR